MFPIVYRIWDLFLVDGFLVVLKSQLQVLRIQEKELVSLPDEDVLMSMKDIEKNPFCVAQFVGVGGERIQELDSKLTKKDINSLSVDKNSYTRLVSHYWAIHSAIQEFWNEDG